MASVSSGSAPTGAAVTVPDVAQARIGHQSQPGAAPLSMLGYGEELLLHDAGFDAISGVMGLSVCHVGQLQLAGLKQPVELEAYSRALTMGWNNALGRLQQEAEMLGADGVIVSSINSRNFDAEEHEYSVKGTAVRFRTQPGALRTPAGGPFVTWLSGMAVYLMLRRGLVPVLPRYAVCVYHVPHRTLRQALGQTFQNTEVPVFTEGWYTAREIALSRLQSSLEQSGAELVMGAKVEETAEAFGEHTAEFRGVGQGWRRMPELRELVPEVDLTLYSLFERGAPYPGAILKQP
jgi:uncharacterized protein YbjQ (UPF0145 family)